MKYIDDKMIDLNKGKAPEKYKIQKKENGEMMINKWAEPKIDIVVIENTFYKHMY